MLSPFTFPFAAKIALLRIADTYFLLREDSLAIENYALSSKVGNENHSYALNQMATSQGLIQDYLGKINTLKRLTDQYPNSKYQVSSLLNLAFYKTNLASSQ